MKHKGIRKKVTITVTILVVCSLTLLGLVLSGLIFINEKNQTLDIQHEVVNYAINEISWDIHELEVHLDITTTSNDLLGRDSKQQHNTLSQILTHKDIKSHDILEELILLDSTGKELSRVSRSAVYTDSDLGDRSDTQEFIIPKESGKLYYGDLKYDEETFEPRITMSMPIPDIRRNEVKGILIGKIRLNRIWENAVVRTFGKSGIIFITNAVGKVVAHPDPSVIYSNTIFNPEKQEGLQPGLNGKTVLLVGGKYHLGNQAFTVFAVLPFSEVIGLSLETLSTTAVFILVFILLSIVLSYFAANRIVQPIETLADNARSITAGNMVSTLQVGYTDEIGDLSKALNTMTSRLFNTITSLEKEVSERKQAEEIVTQQYDLLNNIINSLTHPFYVIDANDYTIKLANTACGFGNLTGESKCYTLTHYTDEPCSSSEHPCSIKKIKETGKPVRLEHIHYDHNGKTVIAEIHGYPIFDNEGQITQVIEYNLDISERKHAEEKINASLKEKEVLLREIHHRVKNNMQIISSLLSLQSGDIEEKKYLDMFNESRNRIKSMALVHEQLYQSTDLAKIDLNNYIRALVNSLLSFYELLTRNISLKVDIDNIALGIDTAIPCGLVINELVTNSLQHAFPDGRDGEINIIVKNHETAGKKNIDLTVSDNGTGMPADLEIQGTKSLGLKLVVTLIEDQLKGSFKLNRENGTEFRISFRELEYKKRL